MRKRAILRASILVALLVAACSGKEGGTWVLQELATDSGPVAMDRLPSRGGTEGPMWITLESGSARGELPCNSMDSVYQLSDGRIVFTELVTTAARCESPGDAVMEAETLIVSAISGPGLTIEVDGGEMVWRDESTRLVFTLTD